MKILRDDRALDFASVGSVLLIRDRQSRRAAPVFLQYYELLPPILWRKMRVICRQDERHGGILEVVRVLFLWDNSLLEILTRRHCDVYTRAK